MGSRVSRRGARLTLALAVLTVAALATTAGTGVAAPGMSAALLCNPLPLAGDGLFDGLGQLAAARSSSARAGDLQREPAAIDVAEEVPAAGKGKGGKGFRKTVDIVFHVISPDGVTGNVPTSVIQQQLTVMNVTFGGHEGGADTGFRWRLAGVDRVTNAEWWNAGAGSKAERDMKRALRVGGADVLNVYTTSGGGYLGWAYYPSTYASRPYIDGVVLNVYSMPGGPYGERYSLGETLTHEAGHWLGLAHTFEGGCNAKGDHVDDTPPMLVPTNGCPEGKDTCREPGLDPIHNYMDYSYDSCYTEFTPGQAARAQEQWLWYRA